MRSGVEVPEGKEGVESVCGARLFEDVVGERRVGVGDFGPPIVVLRVMFVVSADGGGGRWERFEGERMCARQRKHSPVPK
jgi:hypothetical protein